jgi:predicted RNA methylase
VQRFAETTLRVKGKVRCCRCRRCAGLCVKQPDWRAQVLAQLRYDLPASYAFHRAASKDVEVDLWRFEKG